MVGKLKKLYSLRKNIWRVHFEPDENGIIKGVFIDINDSYQLKETDNNKEVEIITTYISEVGGLPFTYAKIKLI